MISLEDGFQSKTRRCLQAAPFVFCALGFCADARAATIAPPMLDITRQCHETTGRNATAMSECVVAESEARSALLQQWSKLADANVQKCVKIGRKARRLPYTTMAKCLAVAPIDAQAAPVPAPPPAR
jgi:hypothetical protein